jgi:DNA-binding transcriptional regulator YdaS (Cro superfamily)
MKLRTYLDAERGRLVRLAKAINAHASDVSAWANEQRPVPIPAGRKIEDWTDGAVGRLDLFPEHVIRDVWPDLLDSRFAKESESKRSVVVKGRRS